MSLDPSSSYPVCHAPVSRPTALVLEDDVTVQRLVAKMLEHLGLQVTGASQVHQAQALCLGRPEGFDLMLVDYGLRQSWTGAEFLRWSHRIYPESLRVLMSGLSVEDVNGLEPWRDFCDFALSKPFDYSQLTHIVSCLRGTKHPLILGGLR